MRIYDNVTKDSWEKAKSLAKQIYEEENGSSWEDADKYEKEDYIWAAYEKIINNKKDA